MMFLAIIFYSRIKNLNLNNACIGKRYLLVQMSDSENISVEIIQL